MKSLNELRDELAEHLEKTAMLHDVIGYTADKAFKDGFDQGVQAERERSQILVEALQFACGNRCAQGINPCNAREALDQYNKERQDVND